MVEDVTYVQLDKEAAQIPLGSGGLIAIETFQGSRTPGMIRPIIHSKRHLFLSEYSASHILQCHL